MHHLIVQLQSRYPSSSLISELLTVHDGNYVVRALIQLGGTTLASGMAAASNIEAAEDRAKVRALEALGIVPTPTNLLNSPLPVASDKPLQSLASTDLTASTARLSQVGSGAIAPSPPLALATPASSPPASKTAAFPNATVSLESDTEFSTEFNIDNTEFYLSNPDEDDSNDYPLSDPGMQEESLQTSSSASIPSSKSSRAKKNGKTSAELKPVEPLAPLLDQPFDNSDVIAQTDVELRRLGWGREQGRKHLEQTYGKRSRQQLTDAELLDFLHYLESQS
ncbi:hypothetical protein H6G00_04035 [Leptolyngbya sp. FACHB-541]|uniref:hypothetical protein n=1 Tax=Leptolyngbya sp. FACHB-541 TaxID=2692810 RepID=UPI001684ADA6|nr:hypothetical protein [Leptolyngbya sp. FACHB-541]MBD1995797.1 hypothetical protein [Leptolyngbya sp. FACHB-541]